MDRYRAGVVLWVAVVVTGFVLHSREPERALPRGLLLDEDPVSELPEPPDPPEQPGEARETALRAIFLEALSDPDRLRRACARFQALGEPEWARKAALSLLEIDPEDAEAHLLLGHRSLREIYSAMPDESEIEVWPDETCRVLLRAREREETWGSPERHAELSAALDGALAHLDRLRRDARYREEWTVRTNFLRHPVYKDYDHVAVSRPPYLVFAEVRGRVTDDSAAKAVRRAERDADLLLATYEEFQRRLGEPLRLPRSEDLPEGCRVLRSYRVESYRSFDGAPPRTEEISTYSAADRRVLFWSPESFVERPGGDPAGPDARRVVHEGVLQLLHLHRKLAVERAVGEEISWVDVRARGRQAWLNVGLAALFSSHRRDESGRLEFLQPDISRLTRWKKWRNLKRAESDLADLLAQPTGPSLGPLFPVETFPWSRRYGRDQRERESLYDAQAWSLCHFLWFADDGEYRERFLDYIRRDLEGRSSVEEFRKAMGPIAADGWDDLERAWHAWVEELWRRHRIK